MGKVGSSQLLKPKLMEELENSSEDDAFSDCCPWLDLTRCRCSCTEYPRLKNVVLSDCTADHSQDENNDANFSSEQSDEDIGIEDEVQVFEEEEYLDEPCDEREAVEESAPLFTEYVGLRGSSFHADCQSTLKKGREILAAKGTVELRLQSEPNNIGDCNAIIVEAKVNFQWDRIGNIPKEKVPKFNLAMTKGELKDAKFKNIRCQYIISFRQESYCDAARKCLRVSSEINYPR